MALPEGKVMLMMRSALRIKYAAIADAYSPVPWRKETDEFLSQQGVTLGYDERCRPHGVSRTVSHVINNDRFVSEAIPEKVEAAEKIQLCGAIALARSP